MRASCARQAHKKMKTLHINPTNDRAYIITRNPRNKCAGDRRQQTSEIDMHAGS